MRQGQQNRRGRGRTSSNNNNNNNNININRKGHNHHNPLMRTFQSNGPDQKIHGTPAQIAEKYMSLARDALSSSDHVLAENYLQHAEHYNRIILTYREQQVQQGGAEVQNGRSRPVTGGMEALEAGDDLGEDDGEMSDTSSMPVRGNEPQPRGFDQPQRGEDRQPRQHAEGYREQGYQRDQNTYRDSNRDGGQRDGNRDGGNRDGGNRDNGNRPYRQRMGEQRPYNGDRGDRPNRGDRPERIDRPVRADQRPDRNDQRNDQRNDRNRADRPERVERHDRSEHRPESRPEFRAPDPIEMPVAAERIEPPFVKEPPPVSVVVEPPAPRRRERLAETPHEQPEFLRRPVRRPRREAPASTGDSEPAPVVADDVPPRD